MPTPIIAFSKDWHEAPTSNHHVLRELARSRRVVWLNSVATRTPQLSSGRDLGKITRKLSEFVHGARNVENDLWVATPLVLPMPHSATANAINSRLLHWTVAALRARLGIENFQLWSFLPNTAAYVGTLGEQLAVYYCVDEWSTFGMLDRVATARAERRLLEKVDITFATSRALAHAKRRTCPSTYLALHGVDHALFARALDDDTLVPYELAALPRPRIGFFGTLREFLDYDLIAGIARARNNWSIVLVGPTMCDVSRLRGLKNVHLLGPRPHDQLPGYCKGFDVGLVPYRIDDAVKFINPLKLREYLSAGVPVVSTPMPEVLSYRHLCHIAGSSGDAVAAIERALAEDHPAARRVRSAAMEQEGWAGRVEALVRTIEEATTLRKGARVAV